MDNSIKISILVPVYNVQDYIQKCVVSLFSQTYTNIEFIFVDDCSTDNSINIVSNTLKDYPIFQSRVKIIHHKVNRGLAAARNTAVDNCSGDYIMHVDSDDFIEHNTVALFVEEISKFHSDIVISDSFLETDDSTKIMHHPLVTDKNQYLCDLILKNTVPSVWGKMYKRKLYDNVRAIEGVNHGEDYSVLPKLVYYSTSITNLGIPLYHYVTYNSNSYTNNLKISSINQSCAAVEEITRFFKTHENVVTNNTLLAAKIRHKLALFKRSPLKLYNYINKLYPEITVDKQMMLSTKDIILLKLTKSHLFILSYLYVHVGFFIRSLR